MTQHTQTIARINDALQQLHAGRGKVNLSLIFSSRHMTDNAIMQGQEFLDNAIESLEATKKFLETKGDQMTHDFLLGYESTNFLVVRWSWLPDRVAEWFGAMMHRRAAKRIERFLAGERVVGILEEGKYERRRKRTRPN